MIILFIRRSSDLAYYVITHVGRACVRAGRQKGGDICCLRSNLNTLCPIIFKLSTTIYDFNVSSKFDYQRNRLSYSRVKALGLQTLLNKLFVRTLSSKSNNQPSQNLLQTLRTIVSRSCSITTRMALVTQELWSLIYRNCVINYLCEIYILHFLTNPLRSFYKC